MNVRSAAAFAGALFVSASPAHAYRPFVSTDGDVAFDAAYRRGLSADVPTWTAVAGVTFSFSVARD